MARTSAKKLTVIGIGTQDTLPEAKAFYTRHKMKVTNMFWDKTGKTWEFFGVPGQPAALLIKNGEIAASWSGAIDERELQTLIA